MLTSKYLKRLAFCRHPRYVFNGSDYVLVRCGKCASCLAAKASRCPAEQIQQLMYEFPNSVFLVQELPDFESHPELADNEGSKRN